MINVKYDGDTHPVATVCYDGPGASDHIEPLWAAGNYGLKGNYNIHGDPAGGGTGADSMYLVASGWTPSGYCAATNSTIFESAASWSVLNYNGYYLDLFGDGGNETLMYDGGGANNTFLHGGDGNDFLEQASSIGGARGDDGMDTLWGLSGGNGDDLRGGVGDYDCLWDDNNDSSSFVYYDCGGQAHDMHDTRNSAGWPAGSCPASNTCCGFC